MVRSGGIVFDDPSHCAAQVNSVVADLVNRIRHHLEIRNKAFRIPQNGVQFVALIFIGDVAHRIQRILQFERDPPFRTQL